MGVFEGAMRSNNLLGLMTGGSWDRPSTGRFAVVLGCVAVCCPSACFFNSKVETYGTTGRSGISESQV